MEKRDLVVFYGMNFKKQRNKYYCNGAFGRYIDELSKNYKVLFLTVPVTVIDDEVIINDYQIQSNNIIIQELPEYTGYISAIKGSNRIKKALKNYSDKWDTVIYIRHPNPFTKYVYNIAKDKNLPVCLHLVGDTKSVVSEGTKYEGIVRFLALKFIDFSDNIIKKMIINTPTLVNGDGLRRLYTSDNSYVREIRTSSFSQNEIVSGARSLDKSNIKLIYVGYLRHEKGLFYLLEAIKLLKDDLNIFLTVVGNGDIIDDLKNKTIELGIEKRVVFKGHVPLGEKLFSIYKEHDIFILPSISEGTPRVLLEAMCNGLPIIASKVGGIPFTIEDKYNGLLVPPKDPEAIVDAISAIVNDDILRDTIIQNGIEFAKQNTLEEHVKEVYDFIQDNCFIQGKKKTYRNSLYKKVKKFLLVSIPVHLIMLLTGLIPNSDPANKIRGTLLRPFFKKAGKNLQIASGVIINHIDKLSVGDDVYIAHNVWINATGGISIDDKVIIGPFSVIVTTEHVFENGFVSNGDSLIAPINIGKGTWLASHVVLTSGITIGEGCLVSAGAVVTKDIDKNTMVGGVPAKNIKKMSF